MSGGDSRPCPVCGGLGRRLLYSQRFMDGPMGDGYDVVVCSNCGAGFADGISSQAEMDRYYAEQSNYARDNAGAESPWDLRRFEAIAGQIAPHLKSRDARILDIGCATGGLLSVFKRRGFGNLTGVDPSAACAAAADRLHGLRVRPATLSQLSGWEERFDLALMVGVLEHLHDVREAVGVASRLLNPGGLVYCAVPDVEELANCPNGPYQQFSIEHVNFFSAASLRRLMAECGMAEVHAWRWSVEWREGVVEPIASGIYQCRSAPDSRLVDEGTEHALERYLAFSIEGDRRVRAVVDSLRNSREPVLVWGAGTLARRLLATMRFAEINIAAFVDSNPHLQGRALAGRPILEAGQISGRTERILVCSISFAREIAADIRGRHGLHNQLISIAGEDLG